MEQWIHRQWQRRSPLALLLLPLSLVYCGIMRLRRGLYRGGWLASHGVGVPVIVVGNITVGGTGKTPLSAWLAETLRRHGYKPGIVSRGYGGQQSDAPRRVHGDSDPLQCGDEPVLLARKTGCPVMVSPDRVAAAIALSREADIDIIIADDGLQHLRLRRDMELAVIDSGRRFGNGLCLPAGALREPESRLRSVDFVLVQGEAGPGETAFRLEGDVLVSLGDAQVTLPLAELAGKEVHAVAGIGNPGRFFDTLRSAGLRPRCHAFPDHYRFTSLDISYDDELAVIMTEKDAVKCAPFADWRCWALPVEAVPDAALEPLLINRLKERQNG